MAAPAAAQGGVSVFARGGGFNALTDFDEAGTGDFRKVGYTIGGGVGWHPHRYVTLRGDFTFARNEFRLAQVATGPDVNRFFYDAAVQLQYPTRLGLEPYVFAGGGAVTLHEVGGDGDDRTRAAGTFGLST